MSTDKSYGIFAEFAEPERLLYAARKAREAGYSKLEAFTPYPLEGLDQIIGLKKDLVALITLLGGLISGVLGFFMQYYANVIDYPINVGGRPDNSWQSFIIITFELTILGAALSAALSMIALNRLPRPHHPAFNAQAFSRASKDRFFLCVKADDPYFDRQQTMNFLSELLPLRVSEVLDEE
jgi:ActD protein